MNEIPLIFLSLILPGCIILYLIGGFIYAFWYDKKNPPEPIRYTWRHVYPDYKGDWERGRVTSVYIRQDNNEIRGKVVGQSDGLYLATMYNRDTKEFMFEYEATNWVEEYKPRIYK